MNEAEFIEISDFMNLLADRSKVITLEGFNSNLTLQVKDDGSPVTDYDINSEKIVREIISAKFPNHNIFAEEMGFTSNNSDYTWIIDPIDGTLNFLHGVPHFAISIAHRFKNEILSGLIFDPIKNEMFYAEKNNGAFFNNQRIRVSNKKNINDCLFGSNEKNIKNLSTRNFGSAALDMAYVGAGRFDGTFYKEVNVWDIAAGIIIIEEAGGVTNKIDLLSKSKINILAGSNAIYENMVKNLNNF